MGWIQASLTATRVYFLVSPWFEPTAKVSRRYRGGYAGSAGTRHEPG
jgi:hypothetical protein